MERLKNLVDKYYQVTEAEVKDVDSLISALGQIAKKHFPKSMANVGLRKGFGSSVDLLFTLGKDKSEYENGIIDNDPFFHRFMVGYGDIQKDNSIKEPTTVELSRGGSLFVPSKNPALAFDRVKVGWRKKTGTLQAIVKHIDAYFKKARSVYDKNKSVLPDKLKNK